jgi:hypothetical protein
MTPADLRAAGVTLYGQDWQTALARALYCAPRTVRHWAGGTRAIPGPVRAAVELLLWRQRVRARAGEALQMLEPKR